jgi:hypothetical protein
MKKRLRNLANPYAGSSSCHAVRTRRMSLLLDEFPDLADMRVVDLGGDLRAWRDSGVRPASLVMLNLFLRKRVRRGHERRRRCVPTAG